MSSTFVRSAARDQDVQATADDALVSKLSAANLGYFTDPYLKFFVRKSNRRSPLINRGYYSRVAAVAKLMRDFLNAGGKQIVSLGAGYDSSYFRLKASGQAFRKYFEVDFPDVCIRKSGLIRKYASPLLDIIEGRPVDPAALAAEPKHSPFQAAPKQNAENASSTAAPSHTAAGPIYVSGPDYVLLEADLRSIEQLESNLVTAGVDFSEPTLFLSECVLVYMKGEESGRVIEWAAQKFRAGGCVMATYEQIRPDDAFGRTMMANLEARGCPLLGLRAHPTLESQKERFESRGWTVARALDMNDVYRFYLPEDDVRRIERLELWDEFEEWNMIQAHYCIATAVTYGTGMNADSPFAKLGFVALS